METKDIVILVVVVIALGISYYRKYKKKNEGLTGGSLHQNTTRNSLKDQADDYEPYSGRKS